MPNATGLKAKFRQLPKVIEDTLSKQIEREANRLVRDMRGILAVAWPEMIEKIDIDWTWGDAPRGGVTVTTVRGSEITGRGVTVFAVPTGTNVRPGWFEFGTPPRYQKSTGRYTGQIVARPFFFPVYRGSRNDIQRRMRAALRRAVKKLNT